MTLPIDPTAKLGESEFSWGNGLAPHPDSNFQSGRLPFPEEKDIDYDFYEEVGVRRSDSVDPSGEQGRELLFVEGNPDRYGGQPAIVQEKAMTPPAKFPVPNIKTGVTREG